MAGPTYTYSLCSYDICTYVLMVYIAMAFKVSNQRYAEFVLVESANTRAYMRALRRQCAREVECCAAL